MIDASALTADLARRQKLLVDDMRARSEAASAIGDALRAEHARAAEAERTAKTFTEWREDALAQSAAAWLVSCAFVRFIEDNRLVPEPFIAGPGEGNRQANDRLQHHFATHPAAGHREYLEGVFTTIAALPGCSRLFDREHSALWRIGPSADAARELWDLFRRIDPETGALVHDFTDPDLDTRFLGDLYQDLSEHAKKTFALLQTPVFVEELILDRTLEPALAEFGLAETTVIDPACGSGHFLLGAFARLLDRYRTAEPAANRTDLVQRVLDQIAGVDLNPFAVAIARFRLLVAALKACGAARLDAAPDFRITLATGDSLLHGFGPPGTPREQGRLAVNRHHYADEDPEAIAAILNRTYAAVVGNPPYITPKDAALNALYRQRFGSCHRQYSLAVPFTERFMDLAHRGGPDTPAGYVGMITANSFMKREFGAKLVREFIPTWDLTTVIDTSGAYIPGHGTPTVILVLRNRPPTTETVRAVMGIRGEPSVPDDAARGHVWSSIVALVDGPGTHSHYVSVDDVPRGRFGEHPWSVSGGGAADLRERIEGQLPRLAEAVEEIGFVALTGDDDFFTIGPPATAQRTHIESLMLLVAGEAVRDWSLSASVPLAAWPYDSSNNVEDIDQLKHFYTFAWPYRCHLIGRRRFGVPILRAGLRWYEWRELYLGKLRSPFSITFAEVATHNHFVLDRGGKAFKQTAPVIKLRAKATEDNHLALLGPLNSSTGCFWLKQVCHNKGNEGYQSGIKSETWERFYVHDGTKTARFPLCPEPPAAVARALDTLAEELRLADPSGIDGAPTRVALDAACTTAGQTRTRMIALQEELDWACYRAYGLLDEDLTLPIDEVPPITLGERAFEIVLARKMAAGEETTAWFERHGSTPVTEVPVRWPSAYRELVERRIAVIASDRDIALIERPEYKRRWAQEPWDKRERAALREWLLDRLEAPDLWPAETPQARTVQSLADALVADADARQVLELYAGSGADPVVVVRKLVDSDAVPYLAAMRYTDGGLRKRAEWERVWGMQRAEDAITALTELPADNPRHLTPTQAKDRIARDVGDIPVPPKYAKPDFAKPSYWPLRGKLDVPKERFISYPTPGGDANLGALAVGWAGWDHVQRARALATRYTHGRDIDGWGPERLVPLLAGVVELLPWVRQWHPEVDPATGQTVDEFLTGFVARGCQSMGVTHDDLVSWRPPPPTKGRRKTVTT